jgi:polygalacturonase
MTRSRLLPAILVSALLASPSGATDADAIARTVLAHAPRIPAAQWSIADFGAVGDGRHDDLPPLRRALRAAHDAGGGRVVVPPGTYHLRGPVTLLSGVDLHLERGATLAFAPEPDLYLPPVLTRWEGTLLHNHSPLVYAFHATDVALTGEGTIDGGGADAFIAWRERQRDDQRRLRTLGSADGAPLHQRVFGAGRFLRPSMVQFFGCHRVRVEGLTFVDSPFWVIHPVFSRYVHITGITIDSLHLNNDGIDPDSSSHVLVEHSRFRTGDDAVAIKSGRDHEGRELGVRSEYIVVRHCVFERVHNAIAIGSEMSGGVRHVHVHDCSVGEGRNLLYFKSNLDRGGFVEDVHVRNINVDTASVALVRFTTDYHGWRGERHPPVFRRIVVEGVVCRTATQFALWLEGHDEAPLREIVLRDITVDSAARPLRLRPDDAITLEDVRIGGRLVSRGDAEPLDTPVPRAF